MRITEGELLRDELEQNVEDVRAYEFAGTRQGCDLLTLTFNGVSYIQVLISILA